MLTVGESATKHGLGSCIWGSNTTQRLCGVGRVNVTADAASVMTPSDPKLLNSVACSAFGKIVHSLQRLLCRHCEGKGGQARCQTLHFAKTTMTARQVSVSQTKFPFRV